MVFQTSIQLIANSYISIFNDFLMPRWASAIKSLNIDCSLLGKNLVQWYEIVFPLPEQSQEP